MHQYPWLPRLRHQIINSIPLHPIPPTNGGECSLQCRRAPPSLKNVLSSFDDDTHKLPTTTNGQTSFWKNWSGSKIVVVFNLVDNPDINIWLWHQSKSTFVKTTKNFAMHVFKSISWKICFFRLKHHWSLFLRIPFSIKALPASGCNPIIKNLNFNQVKIQINTLPMWHCAKMCNWCKLMQMIIQTNNFNTKHVHVLPDLTQFREGGVMTCQSPRDTLTGMWGNLVYHIWECQWSAHK